MATEILVLYISNILLLRHFDIKKIYRCSNNPPLSFLSWQSFFLYLPHMCNNRAHYKKALMLIVSGLRCTEDCTTQNLCNLNQLFGVIQLNVSCMQLVALCKYSFLDTIFWKYWMPQFECPRVVEIFICVVGKTLICNVLKEALFLDIRFVYFFKILTIKLGTCPYYGRRQK